MFKFHCQPSVYETCRSIRCTFKFFLTTPTPQKIGTSWGKDWNFFVKVLMLKRPDCRVIVPLVISVVTISTIFADQDGMFLSGSGPGPRCIGLEA